ncbi:hypothetical protein ACFJIW_08040 [Tahibacter sp. UC22_41]|uniref:hypothetical protein n=1 Tax=Tahibacter sp. UC22_41 TaxID=3350178 RepID=UPI0036DE5F63
MIACLGWGSLVWKPDTLPTGEEWQNNGPQVRVEFLRQSKDGRMTLVLTDVGAWVPSYWVELDVASLDAAVAALASREDTTPQNIGTWSNGVANPSPFIANLDTWAQSVGATHVVWTDLPPKFGGVNEVVATHEQVIAHLKSLTGESAKLAEEYIERAPTEIRTPLRQLIEAELGWSPRNT